MRSIPFLLVLTACFEYALGPMVDPADGGPGPVGTTQSWPGTSAWGDPTREGSLSPWWTEPWAEPPDGIDFADDEEDGPHGGLARMTGGGDFDDPRRPSATRSPCTAPVPATRTDDGEPGTTDHAAFELASGLRSWSGEGFLTQGNHQVHDPVGQL